MLFTTGKIIGLVVLTVVVIGIAVVLSILDERVKRGLDDTHAGKERV